MDIKREVKNLVVYAKCEEAAAQRGDGDAEEYHQQRRRQSLDAIDRWADMANAALAYVEYQINNGWDANVDGATYIRERGKLWDRFVEARAKVKATAQQ